MVKVSVRFEGREKYANAVTSVATGEVMGEAINRLEASYGSAETFQRSAFDAMAAFQSQAVEDALERLRSTEIKLASELGEDQLGRDERDEHNDALVDTLRYVRNRCLNDLERSEVNTLGFTKAVPTSHSALPNYAANAVAQLRKEERAITPRLGDPYTTTALAALVEAELSVYNTALAKLSKEERETQGARLARDEAVEHFERTSYAAAAILEGIFRQAGMGEIADRIRPTTLRVSGRLDEDPIDPIDPVTPIDSGDTP
ncbi:MAG: hypothetical protein AAFS10_12135 [Myxococcota bacterium]